MDALIFDFDGVVVDSEPVHLRCFQKALAPLGITVTEEAYYTGYIGFDDHDAFLTICRDAGRAVDEAEVRRLTATKTRCVQDEFARSIRAMPGAAELIRAAERAGVPLAVCSGALRKEIELAARTVGVLDAFRTIVAAQDVPHGKPDPAGYLLALKRLRELARRELEASNCVVVEDAPAGIEAARAAGMKVLAVTTSYPCDALRQADRVVDSLAEVTCADLEKLL